MLIILMTFITSIGAFCCMCMHIAVLLFQISPPKWVIMSLNAVIGVVLFLIVHIVGKMKTKHGTKALRDAIRGFTPEWMKILVGIMIIYCLFAFAFCLYESFQIALAHGSVQYTLNVFHRGLSALLMMFYIAEFSMCYGLTALQIKGRM